MDPIWGFLLKLGLLVGAVGALLFFLARHVGSNPAFLGRFLGFSPGLGRSSGSLEVLEVLPLGGRHSLLLVRAGKSFFLLSSGPSGVSFLSEVRGLEAP